MLKSVKANNHSTLRESLFLRYNYHASLKLCPLVRSTPCDNDSIVQPTRRTHKSGALNA